MDNHMAIFVAAVKCAQVFISASGTKYSHSDTLQTQAEDCVFPRKW